ncbi:MAG TPA: DUF6084 family protein [Terriglobales bacterium]|nr:DUF6084 family protein [Terriglobales bacterium]
MPDLSFQIEQAEVAPYAIAPQLNFKLRLLNARPQEIIHSVVLRCQIQIEVTRRTYSAKDQDALLDLFGEPDRWGQTLKNFLWTHASVVVPSFTESVVTDVPVPCTFDFNVAATKYFHGLTNGEIPLNFLFSGTVFYCPEEGHLQVSPISWDKEARFRLPVKVWGEMMDAYYPNTAWLCLRRDVFERLYQYKVRCGIPTWEEVVERVLPIREARVQ